VSHLRRSELFWCCFPSAHALRRLRESGLKGLTYSLSVPHLRRFGDGEAVQQDVGRCEDDVEKGARDGPRPLHKANASSKERATFGGLYVRQIQATENEIGW
jgi:hypothetical protein